MGYVAWGIGIIGASLVVCWIIGGACRLGATDSQ